MKITPHRKSWIFNAVAKYARQVGISDEDMPKVINSTKEVNGLPKKFTAGRRTSAYKYFGVCYSAANTLFINVKKLPNLRRTRRTIVHELVHYRFGYLKHGTKFETRINLILKGKPYRSANRRYMEMKDGTTYYILG